MSKPYTVIGYWNDADEPVSVGVIVGDHEVQGGDGATEGGDWATCVEACSAEEAEQLAGEEMLATLGGDDDGDEDDTEGPEVGDSVLWTDPDGGYRSFGTVARISGEIFVLNMDSGGETEALKSELAMYAEG